MRSALPHPMIRFRWMLLALALGSLAAAAFFLLRYKGIQDFPLPQVFAALAATFVWSNGGFWWLEMCYPHIEVAPGQFASRRDLASDSTQGSSRLFFWGYAIAALLATIACINVAVSA